MMPQASADLSAKMNALFGDPVSDEGPMRLLKERGYVLERDWSWSKPGVTSSEDMAQDEVDCVMFMIEEWDFDGVNFDTGDTNVR